MKIRPLIPLILAAALLLSACQTAASAEATGSETSSVQAAEPSVGLRNDADMFTDRDYRSTYDTASAVSIELKGNSIVCSSDAVEISGSNAVITAEGCYILSGTLDNGSITVDVGKKDKVQLVLDNAHITGASAAPLCVLQADKSFVTLAPGSENSLINGGSFTDAQADNVDAALFSKDDLTLNGSGSLTIVSPTGNGIVTKDDLAVTGGTYEISSAGHGLEAKDSVRIAAGAFTIRSEKDGIHTENDEDETKGFVYISGGSFDIDAGGDGISAGTDVQILDGDFTISAGGGSENAPERSDGFQGGFGGGRGGGHGGFGGPGLSFNPQPEQENREAQEESSESKKGIKADGELIIRGGSFFIEAADDAIHSNSSITVIDGDFEITTGDDGFHADETLTVSGGTIHIRQSYEGLEALHLEISGGDIRLTATDDGLNAAGGTDSGGFGGLRNDDHFGGLPGGEHIGGRGGGGFPPSSSSAQGSIRISGGSLYIKAYGDGIDANGTLSISGGFTVVVGPTQGDTATLDYDVSGEITVGTFIGTGGAGMAQTFSASSQGVISVSTGSQSAGTQIVLADAAGNTLFDYAPELPFAVIILSSPQLVTGESYTLSVGSLSKEFTAQ